MPTSYADLDVTENYSGDQPLALAELNETIDSIEVYLNRVKANLLALSKDAFGTGYTFDNDGAANYTNTLFDKQIGTKQYNTADIDLEVTADAAFENVTGTNARIVFTPEQAGDYKITMNFTQVVQFSATYTGIFQTDWKFSDGTSSSNICYTGITIPSAISGAKMIAPVTLVGIFTWADTSERTIVLQKKVTVSGTVSGTITTNHIKCASSDAGFFACVEKI